MTKLNNNILQTKHNNVKNLNNLNNDGQEIDIFFTHNQ